MTGLRTLLKGSLYLAIGVWVSSFTLGCGSDGSPDEDGTPEISNESPEDPGASLEISGAWQSNFGGTETITDDMWSSDMGSGHVTSYNNAENWVVTQNLEDDEVGVPGAYNKIVWTDIDNGSFHYCWAAFGLDTQEEAEQAVDTSDPMDLNGAGCAGFAWTRLTK